MEKSFAEMLVAEHYRASINVTHSIDGPNKLAKARADLIQALTVPAPENDFQTVRDQFAMAALPSMLSRYGYSNYSDDEACVGAYKIADLIIQARKVVS